MSVGVIAALVVGQWPTAMVIVFFMRVGDYAEHFTTERSRQAVKRLTALAPQTARVVREGAEVVIPIGEVNVGETVIVRPGEAIPVDGEVIGRPLESRRCRFCQAEALEGGSLQHQRGWANRWRRRLAKVPSLARPLREALSAPQPGLWRPRDLIKTAGSPRWGHRWWKKRGSLFPSENARMLAPVPMAQEYSPAPTEAGV